METLMAALQGEPLDKGKRLRQRLACRLSRDREAVRAATDAVLAAAAELERDSHSEAAEAALKAARDALCRLAGSDAPVLNGAEGPLDGSAIGDLVVPALYSRRVGTASLGLQLFVGFVGGRVMSFERASLAEALQRRQRMPDGWPNANARLLAGQALARCGEAPDLDRVPAGAFEALGALGAMEARLLLWKPRLNTELFTDAAASLNLLWDSWGEDWPAQPAAADALRELLSLLRGACGGEGALLAHPELPAPLGAFEAARWVLPALNIRWAQTKTYVLALAMECTV
eukprot:scaffold1.g5183.t1